MSLKLTSGAFNNAGRIPDKYAKKSGNVSPPLEWGGMRTPAQSFVLIVDDPDAPSGTFLHWLLYAIPGSVNQLKEGIPNTPQLPDGMRQGHNDFGEIGYGGPQPPSGTHRYFFRLFALDTELNLPPGAHRNEVERAMRGHILEQAELMGRFEHRNTRAA
jgi:Raf kinase inhibitor-like YbhB/YbcL family protein